MLLAAAPALRPPAGVRGRPRPQPGRAALRRLVPTKPGRVGALPARVRAAAQALLELREQRERAPLAPAAVRRDTRLCPRSLK